MVHFRNNLGSGSKQLRNSAFRLYFDQGRIFAMPAMKRPSALKKKKPAAKAARQSDDEPGRKSRVGFKDVKQLADALSPFIEKRFFTSYTTDRAIKSMDKKKLCSSHTGIYS